MVTLQGSKVRPEARAGAGGRSISRRTRSHACGSPGRSGLAQQWFQPESRVWKRACPLLGSGHESPGMSADLKARAAAISFRQCRLFESVGRLASFRRGSEACNLSQPAATQALSKLEHEIGDILLHRKASGSHLTEIGKAFHFRVQRMFAQIQAALQDFGVSDPAAASVLARSLSRSQVRSLIAIIECGSPAKAAEELGVTLASVQRAVRQLEGSLGAALFHRTPVGMMVTPDSLDLGRKLKLATQEIEWGLQEIEEARGARTSQIVLGALPRGGSLLLASVLDAFTRRHPDARIRILTEGASEMTRRLRFGEVDLVVGIIEETTNPDLANEVFAHTPVEVVARAGHPLAGRADITLGDLTRYDWITGLEGDSRRLCLDALFRGHDLPRAPIETSTLAIIRQLVADSDRLTLMTRYELEHQGDGLITLACDPVAAELSVGVTMRDNWLPTRIHQDLIDLIRTAAGGQVAAPPPR
ncbi:MAG: LysR family transcriptional regulator [Caulobacteraceae bacterium]|nr:LysR family transcriptional regulator [Caulobacteraceae bacterium]